MQDIHGILGGGSAGGGRGGPIFGDLRMRAPTQGLPQQQVLKCPRCDSSNTKFCYYNNYNLSQPRHFCKNCRRYWTNGGVLRNVPVGGGCRKNKRSSKRKADSPQATPSTAVNDGQDKSNSHSSSESTSAGVRAEAASEKPPATKPNCSAMSSNFTQLNDHDGISTENSGAREIFTEIGGFPSFMSCNQNLNLFEYGSREDTAPTPFKIHHQNQMNTRDPMVESWPMDKLDGGDHWGAGALDQTVHLDLLPNNRTNDGGGVFASTDWRGVAGGGDERRQVSNFFDLTPGSSAGHGGHWGQSDDQWHETVHDQHLYLPP